MSGSGIDPAWLSAVLRAAGFDVTVAGVVDQPLAAGGAWCELRRLTIRYADGAADGIGAAAAAPATLVAKTPKPGPTGEVGMALGLYRREARFYRDLAPTLPLRTPRCFHAGSGDGSTAGDGAGDGGEPLLLADLGAAAAGDQVSGLGLDRARLLLDRIAALHAAFWDSPVLTELDWLLDLDDPAYVGGLEQLAGAGVPILRARLDGRIDPVALERGIAVCGRIGDVLRACARGVPTLAHNDFRLDNVLFDGAGEPTVLDWQVAARTRGTQDVAYLLTGSTDPDLLGAHWEQLLRGYHRGLTERGVSGYGWDRLVADYRQNVLYSFVPALALAGSLSVEGEHGAGLAEVLAERVFRHAHDIDAAATLD